MQPHQDPRSSRRLAGFSPLTTPLGNPNMAARSTSNTTNATNLRSNPVNSSPPSQTGTTHHPVTIDPESQVPPPPPRPVPPPPARSTHYPMTIDPQLLPRPGNQSRLNTSRVSTNSSVYATRSEATRIQNHPMPPPPPYEPYQQAYHTPGIHQHSDQFRHQPHYNPFPSAVRSNYPPPPATHHPTSDQFMIDHITSFQTRMMEQQQRHMLQMEQRFQDTMTKTIEAFQNSLTSRVSSNSNPITEAPPQEIACSSVSSSTRQSSLPPSTHSVTDISLPETLETTDDSSLSSAKQFIRLLAQAKDGKLHFQTLKSNTDFLTWRSVQAMKCAKNERYKDLTETDANDLIVFKQHPNRDESSTLFMLLYEALGPIHDKIIVDATKSDGMKLLRQIEHYFIKKDTSVTNKETLRHEFNTILRHQNEEYSAFTARYLKKIQELEINEALVTTDEQTRAYKFLLALNHRILKTNICLELNSKPDWYEALTYDQLADKAEKYVKHYDNLSTKKPSKNEKSTVLKNERTDDTSKSDDKDPQVQQYVKMLQKVNSMEPYLTKLKANNDEKFKSKPFKQACTAIDAYDVWKKVQTGDNDGNENTNPPARARRAKTDTDIHTEAITEALKTALSNHGDSLLTELRNMGLNHDGSRESNGNSNNDTNDQTNVYLQSSSDSLDIHKISEMLAKAIQPMLFKHHTPTTSSSSPLILDKTENSLATYQQGGQVLIPDSGATHHMSGDEKLFEEIEYYSKSKRPQVLLGDDTTHCDVFGFGYMKFQAHNKVIRLHALFIPALKQSSLLSIKQHMRWKGTYFHAENNEAILAYPDFILPLDTNNEIELQINHCSNKLPPSFDESKAQPSYKTSTHHHNLHLISKQIHEFLPEAQQHHQFHQTVQIMKCHEEASIPTTATPGSIGFDVTTPFEYTIEPGQIQRIRTGLSTALPQNMYLRIANRSSMALKHITIEGGVIDADYRGEIMVLLKNNSQTPFHVAPHQKIAQFIFETASVPYLQTVASLPPTKRNMGGFGSSDKPAGKRSRYQSFRLDDDYILIQNNSNPFRPVARRVRASNKNKDDMDTSHFQTHDFSKPNDDNDPIIPDILHMDKPEIDIAPSSTPTPTPTKLPIHALNKSIPKTVTMSRDALFQSVGYHNTSKLLKHIHKLGNGSVHIQNIPSAEKIHEGSVASMKSSKRNTTPMDAPLHYSDIWHMDIGYGPCTSIGGIKYTLLLIDKRTKFKLVYGLTNLTTSLLAAMKQFKLECGTPPKLIRTDFDNKLMSGAVKSFLTDKNIKIEAAPPYRQHQNGLVERHWQTIIAMARNWLTHAMLPTKYWFFAVRRAVEVANLFPIAIDDKLTTPFEAVYNIKPDYRTLIPLFAIAHIKQHRQEGKDLTSWTSKSLKCILVGTCSKSNGLLFYHPPSKQMFTCGDGFRLDSSTPAGPHFNQHYSGDFIFTTRSARDNIHITPTHETQSNAFFKEEDGTFTEVLILETPIDEYSEPYTVQALHSGSILQVFKDELREDNPTDDAQQAQNNQPIPFPNYSWIQHEAKTTMFLPNLMPKPKQGFLLQNAGTKEWSFRVGRSKTDEIIPLPNFSLLVDSMIINKKLAKGWVNLSTMITARQIRATSNLISNLIVTRKVSAANLQLLQAPTLLNHHKLHPSDKQIWDASYRDEYEGLHNIQTWETITEEEYNASKHILGKLMPTMAISVIKYDSKGKPDRAKYRIVALGNLDPHLWSKSDCYAPVLSQMELRLLCALAARNKTVLKVGDVIQAFCQSCLPTGEDYVCIPPPGCPLSPPKTYWKLKTTLYGLKRSPRHFYDLMTKILKEIGLMQHPHSPCIFHGSLLEDKPPLYLGLYVDDFCYFSADPAVEKEFEQRFSAKINMTLNGPIQYFLGIRFTHTNHDDGHISTKLSQEAFTETLIAAADLNHDAVIAPHSPYRSGYPIDKIPSEPNVSPLVQQRQNHLLQTLVGSLNWLSISTRPDIAPATNFLAKYSNCASKGHIQAAKHVIKYLKGTKAKGITFSSRDRENLQSHVKFPIPSNQVVSMTDANWGPQDQSHPDPNNPAELELFKSRSMSGFVIWLGGPVHWIAKRQTITARSSAEAEIYATDECVKQLIQLSYILGGLQLIDAIMPKPTTVYNDNAACVCWSKNTTTKGLRHIQMRENAIREAVAKDFVNIQHIAGAVNLADIFTKEDRDVSHFRRTRDIIMADHNEFSHSLPLTHNNNIANNHVANTASTPINQLDNSNTRVNLGGVNLGVEVAPGHLSQST